MLVEAIFKSFFSFSYILFTSIPFFDVNVSIIKGKIITDKIITDHKADSQASIFITLCIPPYIHQTCHSFQFSSWTAPNRSTEETFALTTNELMTYPHKRGYNRHFLRQKTTTAKNITQTKHFYQKVLPPSLQTNLNAFPSYLHTTRRSASFQ